jgi:sugar phosphate permease
LSHALEAPQGRRFRSWRWRIFSATWVAYAGLYFCRQAFYVAKADMGDALGFDANALADLGTAYLAAYAVGQFVTGILGSKTGARVLMLSGLLISVGCNVVFGISNSYYTLLAFMALNGLAQGTGWSTAVGTMAHWTTRPERGTVMGLWATCYQVGGVAAKNFGGLMIGLLSWQWAYFGGSIVTFGAWLYVYFNQRNRPEDEGFEALETLDDSAAIPPDADADEVPAGPIAGLPRGVLTTILLLGGFYFCIKFIRYALWSWTAYLLKVNFGLASDDAAYFSTIFDLAGFAGVIVTGILSDRLFRSRRAGISFLMLCGLLGGTLLLYFGGSTNLVLFGVGIGVVGFMLYGPDSLLSGAAAMDVGSTKAALLAAAVINGMGSIGSVVQEKVIAGNYQASGGEVGSVLFVLIGMAGAAMAFIAVILVRNQLGKSDL